jgi:hypothetical protein
MPEQPRGIFAVHAGLFLSLPIGISGRGDPT